MAISTSGKAVASQCAMALAATTSSSGKRLMVKRSSDPSSSSAANKRSSASRLASSAPSQRMAGPIRARSLRSGPTAKGIIATTIRKNSAPIGAPPPTRSAIRISRRSKAINPVMAGPDGFLGRHRGQWVHGPQQPPCRRAPNDRASMWRVGPARPNRAPKLARPTAKACA